MEYTKLGTTDIEISKVCVGCMSFGKAGTMHDWTLNETDTEAVVRHALDLGIKFFDTANGYSAGTSEEYLGKAIRADFQERRFIVRLMVPYSILAPIIWISTLFIVSIITPQSKRQWKR